MYWCFRQTSDGNKPVVSEEKSFEDVNRCRMDAGRTDGRWTTDGERPQKLILSICSGELKTGKYVSLIMCRTVYCSNKILNRHNQNIYKTALLRWPTHLICPHSLDNQLSVNKFYKYFLITKPCIENCQRIYPLPYCCHKALKVATMNLRHKLDGLKKLWSGLCEFL